ncbi:MAG: Ig domain-containing protein [Planctomycetes bacterium]|nr:Ig domain-containing protein [Planctomycetota bacterium]
MNRRERLLAITVGVLAVAIAGFYVLRQVQAGFAQRDQVLERLSGEKSQKERQTDLGRIAEQRLAAYRERSLPPNVSQARQLYTDWLLKTVNDVGFSEPKVSPVTGGLRSQTEGFTGHTFSMSGAGRLEQLTRLLHQFYSVDYLHRVKSLQVTPRDSKTIAFSMTVEALSLADAPERDQLHHPPSDRLAEDDVQDYIEAICGRNMFGPPNAPPKLSVGSQSGSAGREVTISPTASDPDEDDQLTWSWDSQDVSDPRFDSKTGQLSWTPPKPGEYYITLRVSDDGVPVRTASQDVKITVSEPPAVVQSEPGEDKPPYEQAQFTYVNGITEVDGRRQVWMIDRRSGKSYWLHEGDQFTIGDFEAEIRHIGPLDVEFRWYDRAAVVPLGENLAEDKELQEGELFNVRRDDAS